MSDSFKPSIKWLHTWTGLILGWLLFSIFVTGTISYYKEEINLWMKPELHYAKDTNKSLEFAKEILLENAKKHPNLSVSLPDSRSNTIKVSWREKRDNKRIRVTKYFDPFTKEEINPRKTAGGNFLYRLHFELYAMPRDKARIIVGFATMVLLIAIISGIIIHARIFKDMFTFNPNKNIRSFLDAHVLIGVASLPFLIMITYSGLLLFTNSLMPWSAKAIYENKKEYRKDINKLRASPPKIKKGKKEALREEKLSIILEKARKKMKNNIKRISIKTNKKGPTLIEISPKEHSTIFSLKFEREYLLYELSSTKLIKHSVPLNSTSLTMNINSTFGTLHRARFADQKMRFLFFIAGVCGVIISATGLILWVLKRKRRYSKEKSLGFFLVEKLNIGTILGIFIATGIYFLSNRLIDANEEARSFLEIKSFFIAWGSVYLFAFIRQNTKAWLELSLIASFIFLILPVFDFIFLAKGFEGYLNRSSILYYFDASFLLLSFLFMFIYFKLRRT